jgi:undecaprenyl-diphosphatase
MQSAAKTAVVGWISAAAFAALALIIGAGWLAPLDRALLEALRVPGAPAEPIGPAWLEEAARDITALGGTPILLLLTCAVALQLWINGHSRRALFALGAVGGAQALSELLKALIARPRPDIVPHEVAVYSASFPSGHAMLATAAYFTLAFILATGANRARNRIGLYASAGVLAFLIGASRVYLGVHWPSDVVAGWFAGLAWAVGAATIHRRAFPAEAG